MARAKDPEEKYGEVVDAGIRLLDRVRPGWEREIDLENLDIANPGSCVLGQVYGGYLQGLRAVNLGLDGSSIRHGFEIGLCGLSGRRRELPRLQKVWEKRLRERLHGG